MTSTTNPVAASGTFALGGDLEVHRLGYGAMRITGEGIWGNPPSLDVARSVLRRAVELGVDFLDTADSYGPFVSEDLIREALHPYDGVVVATKGGLTRHGPNRWEQLARPEYLRQCIEMSLRRLDVERIDLWQLHRIDKLVRVEDSLGAVAEYVAAGKIRHVGLSEVSVAEIEQARAVLPIVSVQNRYNIGDRSAEDVVDYCEAHGIAFIPWAPVASGQLAQPGSVLAEIAAAHGATTGQLALAWLLRRSPVILPIPGTGSVAHLEENVAAAEIVLSDDEFEALSKAGAGS
jgi:aryl-alcohol dehydrogenase-like predicted oxidoreductase